MLSEVDRARLNAAKKAAVDRANQAAEAAMQGARAAKAKANELLKAPVSAPGVATGAAIGVATGAGIRVLEEVIPEIEIYDGMVLPKSAVVAVGLGVLTVATGDHMLRDASIAASGVAGYSLADSLMESV